MRLLRSGPILICLSVLSAFSTNRGSDGVWQSEGYGNVFKIQGTHIGSFQFTTTTCVKGPDAHFIAASGFAKNSEGDTFTIRDGDSADYKLLHPIGSAGEIRLDRISTLPSVCNQLMPNTPSANFEVFARNFAEHYISLDIKHVNWDALTEHARGAITPTTSPTQLFEIMKGLIEPFGDAHIAIDASAIHREFEGFRPGGYQLTEGKAEEDFTKHQMPIIWGVTDRFLSAKPRKFANGQIAYGHVGKNIGYLRILAMGGYAKRGNGESDFRILESTQRREKAERESVEAEERQAWCNRWLAYGLRQGYPELPELDPEIAELVTATLAGFSPEQPDFVVQQVIDGAIAKLLAPHILRGRRKRAIDGACTAYRLP